MTQKVFYVLEYRNLPVCLFVIAYSPVDGIAQGTTNVLDRDAIRNLLEESGHDQSDCFLAGEAVCLAVVKLLLIDPPTGCPVGASDIIRFDLQAGNGIGTRPGVKD